MKKIIITIIFFLVLSVPAFGSDWKQVGTGPNNNPIYLDVDNILTKNKRYRIWWKIRYNTPEKNDSGKLMVEVHINSEINCSERTEKTLSRVNYFEDGSNESFNFKSLKAKPTGITPDSVIYRLSKIVCD